MMTPVFGSSGPGEQTPIPRTSFRASFRIVDEQRIDGGNNRRDALFGGSVGRHGSAALTLDFATRIYQAHGNFGAANVHADDQFIFYRFAHPLPPPVAARRGPAPRLEVAAQSILP